MKQLPLWAAALWWGSLTTLGFFVVPMLFLYLPSPAVAGAMAARLFTVQTAISTTCCLLLLLTFRSKKALVLVDTAQLATIFVAAGALLAMLVEFGVAPHIMDRNNLALWHRVGSAMYLLQWLCAGAVFQKLARQR
jgi:hypothetical protein